MNKYLLMLAAFLIIPSSLAQETLTITTYYPAPFGVYQELRARRIAIGDTYHTSAFCWPPEACVNQVNANASLVVEGFLGVGTVDPQANLEVNNTLRLTPTDAPHTSVRGGLYYDDSENLFKYHDATGWKNLGSEDLHVAKMVRAAAQSVPHGGTHKILFDAELLDEGNIAQPGASRFVIVDDGLYLIAASWRCPAFAASQTAGADSELSAYIYINGAEALHAGAMVKGPVNETGFVEGVDVFFLHANDVVEMYVQHTAGGARNTLTGGGDRPRMSIVQLKKM